MFIFVPRLDALYEIRGKNYAYKDKTASKKKLG